jgi:hypothetical protein
MQIYWLLVLVAWGATKLLVTRASLAPRSTIGRQDSWTFGQILPILLLAAPIWSLIGAFVFDDRSEGSQYLGPARENSLGTAPSAQTSTHELVTYFTAPSRVDSRGIGDNNTAADFTTIRYISCYWIGPCLIFPYLVIIGMTILQFLSLALESDAVIEVWVTEYGIIYVFLLIYPFALQFTILLGLVYEEGF